MNYQKIRRKTRTVHIGALTIGGDAPIAVQSMTNTDTKDREATLAQIRALEKAGCDLVRVTVPDKEAAKTVLFLKEQDLHIPIVADIHFDYRLAIQCAEYGVDKIRINPGNIGSEARVKAVCDACRTHGVAIRIGVNSGSLDADILAKYGAPTSEALCESACKHAALLEKFDFDNMVISIKGSGVLQTVHANRLLADRLDYPIHLGVTEAGSGSSARVKSAVGIGSLLCDGIGDTFRISLTEDPVAEIAAARELLNALEVDGQRGMNIVSCPTCGRTQIDLIFLANAFREAIEKEGLDKLPIRVALMGCIVNGPGEAREADIGIAGGKEEAVLFRHGEIIKKVSEESIIPELINQIRCLYGEQDTVN